MDHVLSTHLIVQHRLTTVWLDRIWEAGIPAVEIFCARQHLDYRNQAQIGELGLLVSRRRAEAPLAPLADVHATTAGGARGPHSVITITELAKPKRLVRWWTRSSAPSRSPRQIPFRYLIQHWAWRRGVRRTQTRCGFHGAGGADPCSPSTAASRSCWRTFRTGCRRPSGCCIFCEITHLDLHYCFDTGHAHIDGGRRDGVPAADATHPVDARSRQRRQSTTSICFPFSPRAGPSTGGGRWTCCESRPGPVSAAAGTERGRRIPESDRGCASRFSTRLESALDVRISPDHELPKPRAATMSARPSRSPAGSTTCASRARSSSRSCATARDHAVRRREERTAGGAVRDAEEPDAGIVADRARQDARGATRARRLRNGRRKRRNRAARAGVASRTRSRRKTTASTS